MQKKEQLFGELIKKSKNSIYRVCHSFVDQEADIQDLKQEIYLAIWNSLNAFEGKSSWNTFIYRIALNTAMNFSAKLKGDRGANTRVEESNSPAEDQDDGSSKERQVRKMHKCIRLLDKEDRFIISLVLENLTYKEISEVMGISVNYVGVKVNRAKSKLLEKMKEHHERV